MRSILAALAAVALAGTLAAGCAQVQLYEPVTFHEHEDTDTLRTRFERIADPVELMYEVISTTNYRCDMFFEALDHLQSKTDYGVRQLVALSTGLPPVLEAAHASARAVATVAAALGFATGALKDADYIAKRKPLVKPGTLQGERQTESCLLAFFGADKRLKDISDGDAVDQ